MSYSKINNQELYYENKYENFTYENMSNNLYEDNEQDDLFYEGELVPYNETHDCLRLLQTSEVSNLTYTHIVWNFNSITCSSRHSTLNLHIFRMILKRQSSNSSNKIYFFSFY